MLVVEAGVHLKLSFQEEQRLACEVVENKIVPYPEKNLALRVA